MPLVLESTALWSLSRVWGKNSKKSTRGGMTFPVQQNLEPTTTGLKVQRSNQLSYLCRKSGSDRYFYRATADAVRFVRVPWWMVIFSSSEKPGDCGLRVGGEDPQRAGAEPTVSRRCVVFRQAHENLGGNGRARALLLRSGQAVLVARRRRQGRTHGRRRE